MGRASQVRLSILLSQFLVAAFSGGALAQATFYDFNESIMRAERRGSQISIYYHVPREGLLSEGVNSGFLWFNGFIAGDGTISGSARIFSRRCDTAYTYQMTGLISQFDQTISMSGSAPRIDAACRPASTVGTSARLVARISPEEQRAREEAARLEAERSRAEAARIEAERIAKARADAERAAAERLKAELDAAALENARAERARAAAERQRAEAEAEAERRKAQEERDRQKARWLSAIETIASKPASDTVASCESGPYSQARIKQAATLKERSEIRRVVPAECRCIVAGVFVNVSNEGERAENFRLMFSSSDIQSQMRDVMSAALKSCEQHVPNDVRQQWMSQQNRE